MSEDKMKKYVSIILLLSLLLALIPSNLAQASATQASCTDQATFISDVTIPDKTRIDAGKSFEKTWRLKNSSTCTWTTSYAMVFASGSQMGGPAVVALPKSVSPNGTIDLKVTLTAPNTSGTYTGYWKLRNASSVIFGLGTKADQPFWVQIVVGTSSQPTPSSSGGSSGWKAEYFANTDLYGKPKITRTDSKIDFDWKRNAPATGLPKDNFSVRWTQTIDFSGGIYRFYLSADDKATLRVGDRMVLRVPASGSSQGTYDLALIQGRQKVTLEYREFTGNASVRLSWQKISPSFTDWKGEYWTNAELKGNPAISRNDKAIDFRWREKAPVLGMPKDKFSARWTRTVNFQNATYRFSAKADDGIRVYIDGKRVLNEWHTSTGTTIYTFDKQLKGNHTIVVEYYESTGNAVVKFWWEKVVPVPPTPTTPPTISNVTSSITSSGATVTWTTNEASDSQVEYGPTTSYGSSTTINTSMVTSHSVTLSALSASTTFHYRVKSKNAAGNLAISGDYSFTTPAPPEPQIVYSFAEQACSAEWSSGAGVLPCPGEEDEKSNGLVLLPVNPVLENGVTETNPTLLTVPQQIQDGLIRGTYPDFAVQSGDHFQATIGCLSGATGCDVMFQLNYRIGDGSIQNLASWSETNNGQTQSVNIDLTPLAGKSVKFILTVLANGQPTDDQALWILPRIMR
jgi:hypothetical protein